MKYPVAVALFSLALATVPLTQAQALIRARNPVNIPDIPGYKTLKCDLHMHTAFSDGLVWPSIRSEEAWREGLDVIAITDHIEYQPHKADLPTKHNRSYEIAKPLGDDLGVRVIRGSEITRKMPPGHINAIFLKDAEPLDTDEWRDAVVTAHRQGAFIFWNHPGWKGQQPDGVARWYPEHTALLEAGMLHGIEVVNSRSYYPEAHRWCLEKRLTMLSNSDIHSPLNLDYNVHAGDHRPMTLVFAREKSEGAIREALFARRTAVYSGKMLVGDERFLRPIFENSVVLRNPQIGIRGKQRVYLQVYNDSEIDYELELSGTVEDVTAPATLTLAAERTVLLEVRGKGSGAEGTRQIRLPFTVKNLLVAPDRGMSIGIDLEVTFSK